MTRATSYAWSQHTDASATATADLSPQAQQGLEYARELADDANWRKQQLLRGEPPAPPQTIEQIAAEEGVSAQEIRRKIATARRELFGPISDSAIYKRLQRQQPRHNREPRTCKQPRCNTKLPPQTHASRLYCDIHATTAVRVRRHRQQSVEKRQ